MLIDEIVKREYGTSINILRRVPVSGGDINRAYALELSDGTKIFMKANSPGSLDFFRTEAEGLASMRKTATIKVPRVIDFGADESESFLLLEYIELGGRSRSSSEKLGVGLAAMHLHDASEFVPGGKYGFYTNNYAGSTPQDNSPEDSWIDFFANKRLRPLFEKTAHYYDKEDKKRIEKLIDDLGRFIPEPENPSILHGDLWGGNYMIDAAGEPWLIDPATYVGHAEADLAMTELFGGFDSAFYDAYMEIAGIDAGYKGRKDLYNLYHILNHLNLFGSGYLYSVKSIISRYV